MAVTIAPVASPTTGSLSSPGVGSGLDVSSIVSSLMAVENQPLQGMQLQVASYQAKLSAYSTLQGALSTFQSSLSNLSNSSTFQAYNATSSITGTLTATASANAIAGQYSVNVTQLAQAQTIMSAGQQSASSAIGTGATSTISFQFGTVSGGSFTQDASQAGGSVTIDSTNNSLQGISAAINAANLGVTASIVSDGSSNPSHLVITSNSTGASSNMDISVTGDSALATVMDYNPASTSGQQMTQTYAAQNAQLTVNGMAVTSATNTVAEAAQGVTMNLAAVGSSTVGVTLNTSSATSAINSFVTAFNTLNTTINSLTSFNTSTNTGGLLLGDSVTSQIKNNLFNEVTSTLTGTGGQLTSLPEIGLTLNADGSMSVDSTKLQSAITSNFSNVASLFATVGTATDSQVSYVASTTATQQGSYAVNVTTMATQGAVTGATPPTSTTITAGVNDTLSMTVDGIAANVLLTPGTYTSSALMAQIESSINGTTALSSAGSAVTVSADASGVMSITSNRYGSASIVTASGDAVSTLFGTSTPTPTTGVDVAGTIDGIAASGSGQILTGVTGTATEGLQIQINGGSTGNRGTLNFSQGFGSLLTQQINNYIGTSGLLSAVTTGINSSITSLQSQETSFSNRMVAVQANYEAQFTALDVTIATLNSTSSYLTQQLANLPTITTLTST